MQSAAAQAGLYGPEAPQDVSFIRIINATGRDDVSVRLGDHEFVVEALQATAYHLTSPGTGAVVVNDETLAINTESEQFVSVVVLADGVVAVNDPILRDASRGLLGLMNLTDEPVVSLQTPGGDTVVSGVAPLASAAIAVSRARTELVVTTPVGTIARVPAHTYETGVAYTVALVDLPQGPRAILLIASID